MKLEAGKRYWRRDGGVSGPLIHNKNAVPSFEFHDKINSWYADGNFSYREESPADLIREYIDPQPLEWKRGIPTEEECRECWLSSGGTGVVPRSLSECEIYKPNWTQHNNWLKIEWYLALRIKPVEPPKPKTITQRQYVSFEREELWTHSDEVKPCWTPTGLTREVPA